MAYELLNEPVADDPADWIRVLRVPYEAIRTFVDPSVEFGLRFETQDDENDDDPAPTPVEEDEDETAETRDRDAEIVSLDKFRK